jgi:DNA-directed RNA polymerase subunit E'/Rpb7
MFGLKHVSRVALTLGVLASLGLSYLPTTVSLAHAEEANSDVTTSVDFTGQLIELSSTSVPTVIVVRVNPTGAFTDYTINITPDTAFGSFKWNTTAMEDWMSGDAVRIIGEQDANTGLVDAEYAINQSLNPLTMQGLNGWITAIDGEASTITVQWLNIEHVVNITDDTHLVISPNTAASITDFQIGDRVRVRMNKDGAVENEARFVVALRRGSNLFLKARTRPFTAELNSLTINEDGSGTMEVTIGENDHLLPGDVNNLFGVEGDIKTVTFLDQTKTVRRFMGTSDASEFVVGDKLLIVGRANDDGTISAYMIRDNDIWMAGVSTHSGDIVSIDTATNTLVVSADNFTGADEEVTITYNDDAKIVIDGVDSTESDLQVGDTVRVRGVAHRGDELTVNDVRAIGISRE